MITAETLDVTLIEPRLKHSTIFKHFDELEPGEAFTIHNDHDPRPLYYQLLGERGNIFTWDYLEEGPQWWKVQIAKIALDKNGETSRGCAKHSEGRSIKKMGDFCCAEPNAERASEEAAK